MQVIDQQRGIARPILLLVLLAVVTVAIAGGVSAVLLVQGDETHPHEHTARFLPDNAEIFFSLNLRAGDGQKGRFDDVLDRFRQDPQFQVSLDGHLAEAATGTGISFQEEIVPWIGPEVSFALIDAVESFVALEADGVPQFVALVGTTKPQESLAVLRQLFENMQGDPSDGTFLEGTYRDFVTFTNRASHEFFAHTDEYIVFASDQPLLESTVDRILSPDLTGSLYETARFQEARRNSPNARVSLLYVNGDSIWQDASRLMAGQLTADVTDRIADQVPEWATMTGSFIESGAKYVLSMPSVGDEEEAPPPALPISEWLPTDALAFFTFGVEPDLTPLREELSRQTLGDLLGETDLGLAPGFEEFVSPDATLVELFDFGLAALQLAFGIDVERDLLSWMEGSFALALLDTDVRIDEGMPQDGEVDAVALIQVKPGMEDGARSALNRIRNVLVDNLGLTAEAISYAGGTGVAFDVGNLAGPATLRPGYILLEDMVVVGTTGSALQDIASVREGTASSLADDQSYLSSLNASSDESPTFFASIERIVEDAVKGFDADQMSKYEQDARPFVEPLESLIFTTERDGQVRRFNLILTFD